MNNDVVQEILLRLPIQSLFRFRAVSKSWRDIIDSPSFRELHTHNNNNTVCLELKILHEQHCKLSIKLLDNGKSFILPHNLDELLPPMWNPKYVRFVGPIKGLICIYYAQSQLPIAICNPFLGQFKILPTFPCPQCGRLGTHGDVRIGTDFDGDYKVLELVFCHDNHGHHHHAQVYSRRTDSWRELTGFDQWNDLRSIKPVKSSSKNGYFAHWKALRGLNMDRYMLTFDMRNEVFRATKMVDSCWKMTSDEIEILAVDDGEGQDSFLLFDQSEDDPIVEIIEQGSDLQISKYWKPRAKLDDPLNVYVAWKKGNNRRREVMVYDCYTRELVVGADFEEPSWRKSGSQYVALKKCYESSREVNLYDYRARKFVGRFKLLERSEIAEYVGSFLSVE